MAFHDLRAFIDRAHEAGVLVAVATDLLALQLREQATFDAQTAEIEAAFEYFRAQADYRAAAALDLP